MTFKDVVLEAAAIPELVAQFDRLSGTHLATLDHRTALDAMIDEATGRDAEAMAQFVDFVFRFIWIPLLMKGASTD